VRATGLTRRLPRSRSIFDGAASPTDGVASPKVVLPMCSSLRLVRHHTDGFQRGGRQVGPAHDPVKHNPLSPWGGSAVSSREDRKEPMPPHQHPDVVKRLKRADGHLQTIIAMIEQGRPYVQLAQQLEAVERAIENAKKALIHDYIEQCLDRAAAGPRGRAALRELKAVAKYL